MNKVAPLATLLLFLFHSVVSAEKVYTLQDAYQAAISSNEVVKISEENLLQSESRVDQAWTYVFPKLVGRAGYTRYNEVLPPEGDFVFQPLTQLSAALVLTQPLYTGGRTFAALRTAQTARETNVRDLSSTRQNIALSVAGAYYGVLKAAKIVEKSRQSVVRMERHKQVTEREAATRRTKANISNLLRARTLVSQARIILIRDENILKIARQNLHLLTKLPETAALAEPQPEPEPQESFETLKSRALANRDEYAASKLNIDIAEENLTIVKGAHRPQVYAEGALQYLESHPSTMTDGTIYYGGLRLQVPIFEGGLTKAELSEARSKRRQAELSLQYLQRSIETEVYESYINYQTIASVLKAVRLQYDDAQSNFQAVESLFGQGLVASLALIDAQQALFIAERELVNATYDQQLAILRLQRSVGMLEKPS
jgi:outer membrane protein